VSSNVAYSAPGYLLYTQDDTLVAQAFDMASLAVAGPPLPVAQRVRVATSGGAAFAASLNGRLAYVSAGVRSSPAGWFDRAGRPGSVLKIEDEFSSPALSPDERWLSGQRLDPSTRTYQIWSYDLERGVASRLTDGQSNTSAVWSADSGSVVYGALRADQRQIEAQAVNGAIRPTVLARLGSDNAAVPESLTADGRFLSFRLTDPQTNQDVWVLPVTGDRKPFPVLNTNAAELQSRFSPDGHWLAYTSNESGAWQVYIQPFPATGQKWQVSVNGGGDPQWRGDGQELFYIRPDRMLMAVPMRSTPAFVPTTPTTLFLTRVTDLVGMRNHYAVTRDGQRFLFAASMEEATSSPITIVLNWASALKK
jgi:hypothetical protein